MNSDGMQTDRQTAFSSIYNIKYKKAGLNVHRVVALLATDYMHWSVDWKVVKQFMQIWFAHCKQQLFVMTLKVIDN